MSSAGTWCSASSSSSSSSSCRKGWCRARCGCGAAGWRAVRGRARKPARRSAPRRTAAMTALAVQRPLQVLRRPACHARRQPRRRAGRAAPDHRPERRRQDDAVQPHHRRAQARQRLDPRCSAATSRACRAASAPHLGIARTYQIITLFPRDTILRNVTLALLGLSPLRWNPFVDLGRAAGSSRARHEALARVGLDHLADRPLSQTSYGERRRVEIAMALAQKPEGAAARRAVRRPLHRRAARRAASSCAPSRAMSPS